jgi:hypothetical protein
MREKEFKKPEDDIFEEIDFDNFEEADDDFPTEGELIAAKEPEVETLRAAIPVKDDSTEEINNLRQKLNSAESEKEFARREAEEAKLKAFDVETQAAQSYIQGLEGNERYLRTELRKLEGMLEDARADGNPEAVKQIRAEISQKQELQENIKGQIAQATPFLNRPRPAVTEREKPIAEKRVDTQDLGSVLTEKWEKENASWLDDPEFMDRKKRAFAVAKELYEAGYKPSSIKFWTTLDKRVADGEVTQVKRRTQPVMRGVTMNNSTEKTTNKRKVDAEVLAEAKKNLEFRARRPAEGTPEYKKMLVSYVNTALRIRNRQGA